MINKEQAAEILGINPKALSRFDNVEDPFNVPNSLSGWISHQADYRYGALVLDEINGILVAPRAIYGIPKIHYPFRIDQKTEERIYDWGVIDRVEAYTKFDGTNVTAYRYFDAKGKPYVTFKLRLYPVMRNNRFGDLCDLWQECLGNKPELQRRCLEIPNNWFPSFEMYGYKNPHMVVYKEPIDFVHLCMIGQGDNAGKIDVPYKFDFVKTNRPYRSMESGKELTAFYEDLREEAHTANQGKTEYGELNAEGYVMYAKGSKGFQQFKIKAGEVEDIAWARGMTIKGHVIETTCWNAFEHVDEIDYAVIEKLLLEEFPQEIIDKYENKIKKVLTKVKSKQRIKERALSVYETLPSEVREGGRSSVMRAMSKEFQKSEIVTCFNMLRSAGVFEEGERTTTCTNLSKSETSVSQNGS